MVKYRSCLEIFKNKKIIFREGLGYSKSFSYICINKVVSYGHRLYGKIIFNRIFEVIRR